MIRTPRRISASLLLLAPFTFLIHFIRIIRITLPERFLKGITKIKKPRYARQLIISKKNKYKRRILFISATFGNYDYRKLMKQKCSYHCAVSYNIIIYCAVCVPKIKIKTCINNIIARGVGEKIRESRLLRQNKYTAFSPFVRDITYVNYNNVTVSHLTLLKKILNVHD